MDFPSTAGSINPAWLLSLGLSVGILSGFFGVGGGFLVTGGLIVLGVPEFYAVGTGLALITGSSTINALKHRKLGNVDFRLGLCMVLGSIPGVESAKRLLLYLEGHGLEDEVIHYVYVVVLTCLGAFLIYDWLRTGGARRGEEASDEKAEGRWVRRVRAIALPPRVALPVAGIPGISVWVLIALGFCIGLFAGLLGAGGGFLLMPALVFLLGIPTITAIGTDLFQVMITGSYGALTYALDHKVDLLMALVMLVAASVGSQVGALATRVVDGSRIRFLYAITVLAGSVSLALDQASKSGESLAFLSTLGAVTLLGVAGAMCLFIAALVVASWLRAGKATPAAGGQTGHPG